jgi:hypothetical protein
LGQWELGQRCRIGLSRLNCNCDGGGDAALRCAADKLGGNAGKGGKNNDRVELCPRQLRSTMR